MTALSIAAEELPPFVDDDGIDLPPPANQPGMGIIGRKRPGYDIVMDSGPDGNVATHEINRRQRMIDQLHDHRTAVGDRLPMISDTQYDTAKALLAAWEGSGRSGIPSSRDLETPMGGPGGSPQLSRMSDKFDYLMTHVSRDARHLLMAVVLTDEHPESYGQRKRCWGLGALQRHLDAMSRPLAHWDEMEERARAKRAQKPKGK